MRMFPKVSFFWSFFSLFPLKQALLVFSPSL